jgi:hypothetical protein
MPATQHADHYETLQVSRSADPLIITKAYQILVGIYHPDNKDTGDVEQLREIITAYDVLSDPIQRAQYDRTTFGRSATSNGTRGTRARDASAEPTPTPHDERQLRSIILQTLYTVRRTRPSRPGVSLISLAEVCDCSVDAVQFSLWYLRGKNLIENTTDGDIAITVRGVDHLEAGTMTPNGNAAIRALPASSNGRAHDDADAVLTQPCRLEF